VPTEDAIARHANGEASEMRNG